MDKKELQKINNLKKWIADRGKPSKSFEKESIGEAEEWLVNNAKEAGIDINGFEHDITNYFINHVLNRHGDPATEEAIGQIAVKEEDFNNIADIVKNPDRAIIGAKRNGDDILFYAKKMDDGSTIYLEQILNSKKNKALRGKTLFRKKDDIDENALLNIASNKGKTDLTKAKTVDLHRTGGNPSFAPVQEPAADATSTFPVDQLSNNNLTQSAPNVKGKNKDKE